MKKEIKYKGEIFYLWGDNLDGTHTYVNNKQATHFGTRYIVKKLKTIIVKKSIIFRKKPKVDLYKQSIVDAVNNYRRRHKISKKYV